MGNCISSLLGFFRSSLPSTGNSCTSVPPRHQEEPPNAFAGIVAQASPSSSAVLKKGPYDVFINHRGCDTKHKLASTIYHTLDLIGLRAFLDENELELGDSLPQEIEEAMRNSGLHIAILSERYAESPWCLAELCFIVKSGKTIIPVFYHVKPDDLRWVAQRKGCYAHAFSQHEEKGRYSSTILEDWKSALQKVSYISGYMFNNPNDDEGMLLKSIVNSVAGTMKKVPLDVAKHPVAMDEIVDDFERSRGMSVQIEGIVGFGGSGKTTLATELYNRKSSSFERSSFQHDVRDAASRNALHTKQKKLLEDLRMQGVPNFDNFKEGKGFVADRLKGLRVLLVLDDADHEDQLDALLPAKESLGSGSLVIITTREGDLLRKWGITSIYKMRPLQHLHARKLFCWHAFLQPFPQQGFEGLVENYIDSCKGLPLSLKVIGGQLYGKRSKDYWYSQLDKIQRILPEEILERLKVSYDALDEDDKEIFLDVACFFIGERRSSAIAVWDGSGWSGLCSWETLLNKCLVEVDDIFREERIRMHDHLRDLGRQIAKSRSPSRICHTGQSMHIQPGMPVRGITTRGTSESLFKEYMEMMRNSNVSVGLQLLDVGSNELTRECGELSRGLLWLRCSGFRHRNIPQWLSLENIRVLSLSCSENLESLWEDDHAPLELRELAIEHGKIKLRSLPRSIGHLKHLKRLVVTFYGGLSSLPEEFCRLQSLEHLVLRWSKKLSSLPNGFGDLVNLRHIDLGYCERLNWLPVSFKKLIHLEYLDLGGCDMLTLETDILDNMTNLKVFQFYGGLSSLPEEFCRLQSLEHLVLKWSKNLSSLPNRFGDLVNLRHIDLRYCQNLYWLPVSFKKLIHLEYLDLHGCRNLTLETDILDNMTNLKVFQFSGCESLQVLPHNITGQASLTKLHFSWTRGVRELPASIDQLSELKELLIEGMSLLTRLPSALGNMSNLIILRLVDCPELYDMPNLGGLVSLNNLSVEGCPRIMKIEGLEHLRSLEKLNVQTDWMVPGIHSLRCAERPPLRTLTLQAADISAFGACTESVGQMEKWPCEMTLCGKFFASARSILDNFTFPGLVVGKKMEGTPFLRSFAKTTLLCEHTNPSDAAIVCFHVKCEYEYSKSISIQGIESSEVRMSPGEWIVMTVLREVPLFLLTDKCLRLSMYSVWRKWGVSDGWMIVGARGDVIAAFKQLFQTLCQASHN